MKPNLCYPFPSTPIFQFITFHQLILPRYFPMTEFFNINKKSELHFIKTEGYDILNDPKVPDWYNENSILNIALYRNRERAHMGEFREFASTINCICLGDFGLALLWYEQWLSSTTL